MNAAEVQARAARLIVHQFDPSRVRAGGVDTCISDLIAYAPTDVVFAVIGVTSADAPLGRWTAIEHRGRELLFMPVARLPRGDRRHVPFSLRLAAGLTRWRPGIPDVTLQAHRVDVAAAVRTVRRPAGRHIQFVHNPHGRDEGVLGTSSDSFWRFAPSLYGAVERRQLAHADRIVVFSRREAERLQALGHAAIAWQTWFDPAVFFVEPRRTDDAEPLSLAWIGRFERQKDPLLALEVFAELCATDPGATLTMLGGGALRGALERGAVAGGLRGRVTLRPTGDRGQVASLMRRSHVVLLTSRYEGSPRVLVEALASGTPVAATPESDPDELLVNGENGVVARSRRPSDLAAAVRLAAGAQPEQCAASVAGLSADEAVPRLLAATENSGAYA